MGRDDWGIEDEFIEEEEPPQPPVKKPSVVEKARAELNLVRDKHMDDDDIKLSMKKKASPGLLLTGLAMGLCLLLFLAGLGGAYLSCKNGGGEMAGFSCMNIEVTGACELDGRLYTLEDIQNGGVLGVNLTNISLGVTT